MVPVPALSQSGAGNVCVYLLHNGEPHAHSDVTCLLTAERAVVSNLQKHPQLTIYFAPGPRLSALSQGCIETLFNLHCILHLNEEEACSFTGCPTVQQAAESLYERTHNIVIITLGSRGCLLQQEGKCTHIPTEAVQIQDTIGAGDAHIGSIIALREQGYSWQDTLRIANRICGYIVSIPGALIHEDELTALSLF